MTTTETPLDPATLTHEDAPMGDPITPSPSVTPASTERDGTGSNDASGNSSARPARPPFLRGTRGKPAAKPAAKPKPDKQPRVAKDDATLKKALVELYSSVGMVLLPFDQPCATVVVNSADQCAEALIKLAAENDSIRRALTALTQTSAWGGVIAAHLPIIMAVTSHHMGGMKGLNSPLAPTPDNVVNINEDAPQRPATVRSNRAADGFGRFCTKCNAALQRGVVHQCTEDGA